MRNKAIMLLFLFITGEANAQLTSKVKTVFEMWQQATVSLGDIKQKKFHEKNYPYYNILGSGVFAYITLKGQILPVIITARHVLQNKNHEFLDSIHVRVSWASDSSVFDYFGSSIPLKIDGAPAFITLPDTTIDLACIPLYNAGKSIYRPELITTIPFGLFANDVDYYEGREIFTIGYPASIGSKYWTRGLLRKGIISWLPNFDIETKKFIIDCNVYPGNSGGPVFSIPLTGSVGFLKDTTMPTMKFLGIVIERRLNYNDVLKLDTSSTGQTKKTLKKPNNKNIKKNDSVQLLSSESMGVGIVEPAENVLKLLNYTEEHLNASLK